MADGKIMNDVRADDSELNGDIDRVTAKVKKGATKQSSIANKAMLAVGKAFVEGGAAVFKYGAEFETSMAMASTLIDTSKTDMASLNNKMLELSSATGVAASELGGALYQALSAGVPATENMAEAMEFLEKNTKLAKAAGADMTTVIDATASVINAYGLELQDTDKIHKILMQTQILGKTTVAELGQALSQVTPIAASSGVSFDQVGAAIANMTAQGTPATQVTTQLNSLFAEFGKNGTLAAENLAKATEGTELAGKSFQDLMKDGIPLNKILDVMNDYANKNGLSMLDMFSSIEAGNAALANGGQNSQAFADALEAMATEADLVGDAFDKVAGTTSEQLNKVLNELKNIFIQLFIVMKPAIDKLLPALSGIIKQLEPLLSNLVIEIMPLIVELIDKLLPSLLKVVDSVLPILIVLLTTLIPPFIKIVEAILPPLMMILNALLPILDAYILLLTFILDIMVAIIEPITLLITEAIEPLIAIISLLIDKCLKLLEEQLKVLKEVFELVLKSIVECVSNRFIVVKGVFENIIDFIKNVFTGNWKGAWEAVKDIFANIWEGIKNAVKAPLNFIIDAINKVIGGLNSISIQIPDWVPIFGGKTWGINIPEIPRLKNGANFIPKDVYPAYYDYGESVLTKEQNLKFNTMGGLDSMERMIGSNMQSQNNQTITVNNVMQGDIDMDGFKVGTIVMRNIDDVKRFT